MVRREGKRGPVWYAKYRLPDGRQVQKRLGPAWTGRTRPPAAYLTQRQAEQWLAETLTDARRGTLPGLVRTGATVADAAAEYLRNVEHDRARKPTTVNGYRWIINHQILPVWAERRLEDVTTAEVEAWIGKLTVKASSRRKALVILHGIYARARKFYGLKQNPVTDVEKPPLTRSGDIDVFSPEEIDALTSAAESEQDAAIFQTAAFTGLPEHHTADDDLVFAGDGGGYVDGSAMRRRYTAALSRAGLRRLRFHDPDAPDWAERHGAREPATSAVIARRRRAGRAARAPRTAPAGPAPR